MARQSLMRALPPSTGKLVVGGLLTLLYSICQGSPASVACGLDAIQHSVLSQYSTPVVLTAQWCSACFGGSTQFECSAELLP